MNDREKLTQVDPEDLWRASKVLIPEIAAPFGEATRQMQSTNIHDAAAFGSSSGGWTMSKTYGVWNELQDNAQTMFREIATRLDNTGEAMYETLQAIIGKDKDAADDLRKQIADSDWPTVKPDDGYQNAGQLPKPGDPLGRPDYMPNRPELW